MAKRNLNPASNNPKQLIDNPNKIRKLKTGRKTLFKDYMIQEAYKLGALGLIQTEIATIWGVSAMSLNRWSRKYPAFSESLKRGKEEADASVVEALLKECKEKGNITGIIFWLKNRQPKKWRDKHEWEAKVTNVNYSFNGAKDNLLSNRDKGILNVNSNN